MIRLANAIFDLPWWADWIQFGIIFIGALAAVFVWLYTRCPPKLKMFYIKNPLQYPKEEWVAELRVPRGHDITVYHRL